MLLQWIFMCYPNPRKLSGKVVHRAKLYLTVRNFLICTQNLNTMDTSTCVIMMVVSFQVEQNQILKKHVLWHGTLRFLCTFCGEWFAFKSKLNSHISTHPNEKKYKCTFTLCTAAHKSATEKNSMKNLSTLHPNPIIVPHAWKCLLQTNFWCST